MLGRGSWPRAGEVPRNGVTILLIFIHKINYAEDPERGRLRFQTPSELQNVTLAKCSPNLPIVVGTNSPWPRAVCPARMRLEKNKEPQHYANIYSSEYGERNSWVKKTKNKQVPGYNCTMVNKNKNLFFPEGSFRHSGTHTHTAVQLYFPEGKLRWVVKKGGERRGEKGFEPASQPSLLSS